MAGGRIKGITVEIGGDTTKLQTALKGVNSQIKNTQSQLKDVEKLLKLDPGNTELLSQKQKLLSQSIQETKEKLTTLKTAAEQANQALGNGEISQEQYDALQREIIETENELKRLEQQARESGAALQEIAAKGEKLKTVGDSVTNVGEKFMPATAAVVGLGAAAVKTAADFDSGMSKVAAISGATGDDLQALRDKAREMGSKTKFSASEAAEAMEYMAMAGWKTTDMLGGIEGIMNLAAASGESLATTSDIVTDALTAFGLKADDAGHFSDVLAAASSNANTNVSMMGETFKYAAPIAGALGFSVEDTAEAIGLMANAGIKGSQAGTSLRTIMNNLAGEVKICGSALGEVTIQTTNADGSMRELSDILADCRGAFSQLSESEQAAAAEALVGKNAMSGFLALMNAAPEDIDKLSSAIENCDGKSAEMAATMQDNLAGQLTILKSQLEELAISFGEILMPAIRSIVSGIQGFVDKLNSMDETTKKVIVTIALIVAAIGPVLIVVGKVISAVGTIMTIVPKVAAAIKAVKGAFAGLNAVMAANPIILVIAAIAALVAAFIYLWNTSDEFRQFWIDLWENIKAVAIAVWEAISTFFSQAWEAIKATAETVWNAIKEFFSGLWEDIKSVFETVVAAITGFLSSAWEGIKSTAEAVWNAIRGFFTGLWDGIKSIFETVVTAIATFLLGAWNGIQTTANTVWTAISGFFTSIWDAISTIFTTVVNAITTFLSTAWAGIQSTAQAVWNAISSFFSTIWNGIQTVFTTVVNAISSFLTGAWNGIQNTATAVWNTISGFISTIWSGIQNTVTSVASAIGGFVSNAWNGIKNTVTNLSNGAKTAATTAFNNMKSGISTTVGNITSTISSGFNSAVSFIKGLAGQAFSWGSDIIGNIVNGIRSMIGRVRDAASSVASAIRSFLHFSVPDEGPLADFESWMPDFMSGLAKGIDRSKGTVEKAIAQVADLMDLKGAFPDMQASVNANLSGGTGGDSGEVTLNQPILLDGRVLTTVVSRIQYAQGKASLRNLGTI